MLDMFDVYDEQDIDVCDISTTGFTQKGKLWYFSRF